jgi:mannose-6-phosphate isomerase-like protein (cupin superfamily)
VRCSLRLAFWASEESFRPHEGGELREGTLLLISRGDKHEIRSTGTEPLRTLNVYVPPAYTDGGEELPAGQS